MWLTTAFREIEEIEKNLILPSFRKLKFVDCSKPFWKKLMHMAFLRAKAGCDKWHDYEMTVAPYEKNRPIYYEFTACPAAEFAIRNGVTEIMPALCNVDFASMELLHARLVRTTAYTERRIPNTGMKTDTGGTSNAVSNIRRQESSCCAVLSCNGRDGGEQRTGCEIFTGSVFLYFTHLHRVLQRAEICQQSGRGSPGGRIPEIAGVECLELVVAFSIGADFAMAFLTGTKLPIGHIFFDGGQFARIGKGTRRIMTPFLYLVIKSLYWSKGGTLKKILWCDDDSIKPYFIAAGENLTYTNLRRQISDSLEDKPFPSLPEELQKQIYFEFGSIEDHFKYRQAVMEAYPCGHYPVFEGYDHMQYQIRDPRGFAEMLASIAEHDGMPKLPFSRK